MCNINKTNDIRHQLWLIYSQLKDAESDEVQRLEQLECARERLGDLINELTRQGNYLQRK
jgi:hypothetical protein